MTRRRILVVDDEPGMLRAVRRVLEGTYTVECCGSSVDALEQAAAFRPDLAVLDIRMPGLDGFELMKRLKLAQPDLDVILMTGSVTDADRKLVRSIRQRAFYFIRKPFDREVLLTLVERCLELRRLSEENRSHVERLENVLAEARAFQRGLLPASDVKVGGTHLVARYRSCETLCGDFYDHAAGDDGAVAFLVADVSGHGASAAMLTGVVKSSFQSCQPEGHDPLAVVERIAAGIGTFRSNRFVTLFCGRIDPGRGLLEYVNAAHPPALLWASGAAPRLLAPTGTIVSPVLGGGHWKLETVEITPGSRILLYTDGITEAPGEDGDFGTERILDRLRRNPAGGATLLDGILNDVEAFLHGRAAEDDMTLLTLRLDT